MSIKDIHEGFSLESVVRKFNMQETRSKSLSKKFIVLLVINAEHKIKQQIEEIGGYLISHNTLYLEIENHNEQDKKIYLKIDPKLPFLEVKIPRFDKLIIQGVDNILDHCKRNLLPSEYLVVEKFFIERV